jgi:hypothetical protein
MNEREKQIVNELITAIERQLSGTGRGIPPSERLEEAIAAARAIIEGEKA